MAKLILTNVGSGYQTAAQQNANNDAIEAALENTLSRNGQIPNQMTALLDMNGAQIINLGKPQNTNNAARLQDILDGVINVTGIVAPAQLGNNGKSLATDGTNISWGNDVEDRTPAEIAAGVTPVNFAYPEGYGRRYGYDGDTADESAALQAAVNVVAVNGGTVRCHAPISSYFNHGTTTITVPSDVWIEYDASQQSEIRYAGTGLAFDLTGADNGLRHCYVKVTDVAGSGIRFNGISRFSGLQRVTTEATGTPAANRTGAGVTFRSQADGAFSGNFLGQHVYSLGFLYGHRYIGNSVGLNTWTTVTFLQSYVVGNSALIGSSRGVWMDSRTNGVGTVYEGGTIEGWGTGIYHESGGRGLFYRGDMEGNTTNHVLGASFDGSIEYHNAGNYYKAGSNSTVNRWYQERELNGVYTKESFYGPQWAVYDHGSESVRVEWFRVPVAASIISGTNTPVSKFAIQMDDSTDQKGTTNWFEVAGHKMCWHTAAPTVGTWGRGDVIWNSVVAAAGSPGWVCTAAGTFSAFSDVTGDTDGSTAVITGMTSTTGLSVGNYVSVSAGFATTGPFKVLAITPSTITVDANSNSVQVNVTVSTPDPVFKTMAVVAA